MNTLALSIGFLAGVLASFLIAVWVVIHYGRKG
jgi:preprotein translocase subunit SecF